MIICIKIGQNENDSYPRIDKLSRHFDIIEVLPRKRDGEGKLIDRTLGEKGDREYFALHVDTDDLTDDEFNKLRWLLRSDWIDYSATPDERGKYPRKAKRINKISEEPGILSGISISQVTINNIISRKVLKNNKQSYDMRDITRLDIKIPFNLFAHIVINKDTGQSLYDKFELATQTLKEALGD